MSVMKVFTIFCAFCYLVNGNPAADPSSKPSCATSVTAFPPDPKTNCCGATKKGKKITNGPTTEIDGYPWTALIEYNKDGKIRTPCHGALISGRYILTAAYCVAGEILKLGKPENIRLGEYDTSIEGKDCKAGDIEECTDGAISIPIETVIIHPDFNKTMKANNIALIRMASFAPYTDFISPICLPTEDVTRKTDVYLQKAGWASSTDERPTTRVTVKDSVSIPLVPREECNAAFNRTNIVLTKNELCAGGRNDRDFCKGDLGAALSYNNNDNAEVVGIVSFGLVPCRSTNPNVNVNVYEYLDWIRNSIVA